MRWMLMMVAFGVASLLGAEVVSLWEVVPGAVTSQPEVERNAHLYHVSQPTVAFLPTAVGEGAVAPVVLVMPGGGYGCLAYEKEGLAVGRWLNGLGFHAAVVKYRIPGDRAGALMDAQRAVALLRERASEWKIDTQKMGMIGFSAGAHLTARVLAHENHGLAFALLIYPAYLSKDGVALVPEVKPAKPIVPTFVTQCNDDRAFVMSSLAYAGWLCKGNFPVAYHLYPKGGHGFGLNQAWSKAAEAWLEQVK